MRLFIFTRFGVLLWELAVTSATGERPQRGQMRDVRCTPPTRFCRLDNCASARPAAEISLRADI